MKVQVEYEPKKVIKRIIFDDPDHIDRTKLGERLGKTKQYASYLITTGEIPSGEKGEELLKKIREIPPRTVYTTRKLPTKKVPADVEIISKGARNG